MSKACPPPRRSLPAPPAGEPPPPQPAPPPAAAGSSIPDIPFDPVPVQPRRDGWTPAKQRAFIQALAECGVVSRAAAAVGMTERSAHRLALRPDAESFRLAWDAALQIAARRGASLLFEYAYEGVVETVWRDGELVCQRRRPSEKALFFLLSRLDPYRFGRRDPAFPDYDPIRANLSDLDLHLDSLDDPPADEDEEGGGDGPEAEDGPGRD
ncbi:MAG TPA: hypothetical protein VD887_04760 [Allosphingosinicella sp.]|nr:hypothetical protein [Allosphingosinicella sp.]